MTLDTRIQYLRGVGPKIGAKLSKAGLSNFADLLYFYPRDYRDYSQITKIGSLLHLSVRNEDKPKFTIRGKLISVENKKTSKRRFIITEGVIEDETGSIKVIWFNQPFLTKSLHIGQNLMLYGSVQFNFFTKEVVLESPIRVDRPRIAPVYSGIGGIKSSLIEGIVKQVLLETGEMEEWLPQWLTSRESEVESRKGLLDIQEAIKNIHQPESLELLEQARRRIAFDELFLIALQARISREELKQEKSIKLETPAKVVEEFIAKLPFELTGDQRKAVQDIVEDLRREQPMSRLLNGDVGSGKTVVAAIASMVAVTAGFRVVLMAPTEILAGQHFKTFCKLFEGMDVSVGIYTSSCKDNFQFKNSNLKSVSNSKISKKSVIDNSVLAANIVIGTQALIQEGVELLDLGLVIIDEQHRFGVKQREALLKTVASSEGQVASNEGQEVGEIANQQRRPHFLSMTATPIPRTLHLTLFGDLRISVISEKPANRKEIKTRFVESHHRDKAYEFIRAHLKAGRQVFVICPLIEEKESDNATSTREEFVNDNLGLIEVERKTVKREYEKLQQIYSEFQIGMLHGKMKSKEKDCVMTDFSNGKTSILVSTSVVEVGVDVPNATVMIIEDAERFGLAQIHQFRGRVGRGEYQSFCFLFSSTKSPKALERLRSLEMTSDGFKLAEIDLEQRGPGSVFGTEQSGMLDLKMANFSNLQLIEEASTAANNIVEEDPELKKYPLLKEKIANYLQSKHLE